jgi:hypothetical protein
MMQKRDRDDRKASAANVGDRGRGVVTMAVPTADSAADRAEDSRRQG